MCNQLKQLEFNFNKPTDLNGWLCDECLSNDIIALEDLTPVHNSEMDIYCNECKCEQYKISEWFVNLNKSNNSLLALNK